MTTRIDLDSLDGILPLPGGDTNVAPRPVAARAPVSPVEDEGPTEAMSPAQVAMKTAPPVEDVTMAVPPPSFSAPTAKKSTQSRSKGPFVIAAAVTVAVAAVAFWTLSDRQTKPNRTEVAKTAVEAQTKTKAATPPEAKTGVGSPEADSPSAIPENVPTPERTVAPPAVAAAAEVNTVPAPNPANNLAPTADGPSQKRAVAAPREAENAAIDTGAVAQNDTSTGQKVAIAQPQKTTRREAVLNDGILTFPAFFEHNSWKPQLESQGMGPVKQWLTACKGTIQIIGHTSLVGRDEINDAIGLARARAVQMLLKSQIKDRRVDIQSAGSREPMERAAGEPAQSKNRRVQLKCDS